MMKIKLPDVRNVLGWMLVEEMILLARVALNSGGLEGDLVEIGSYCGRSTVVIGDVLRQGLWFSLPFYDARQDFAKL